MENKMDGLIFGALIGISVGLGLVTQKLSAILKELRKRS